MHTPDPVLVMFPKVCSLGTIILLIWCEKRFWSSESGKRYFRSICWKSVTGSQLTKHQFHDRPVCHICQIYLWWSSSLYKKKFSLMNGQWKILFWIWTNTEMFSKMLGKYKFWNASKNKIQFIWKTPTWNSTLFLSNDSTFHMWQDCLSYIWFFSMLSKCHFLKKHKHF